ncbi:DUF6923 family protein [Corallococcus carmarthensis]|uniref:DUF6923 family protein n=1 Tax=Corallococcus carmarthensis TaxID=2316728 RepID=UPI00148D1985|nr:hypothetical protein [Corallococcus carmarthensis]NOK18500.1 hypothetical protein [Corallococcus carmarthensis]
MWKHRRALTALALAWALPASAHDILAGKTVNGGGVVEVSTYPTTVTFGFTAQNIHPTLPSTLLSARDPLLESLGFAFDPPPPFDIPLGGTATDAFSLTLDSFDTCVALGNADDDPTTPGPGPGARFTSTFTVTFPEGGTSQASTQVICLQDDRLTCDDTLYVTTGSPSTVAILDPVAGTLTPLGAASGPLVALGFNQVDGYLYAVQGGAVPGPSGPTLYRVAVDGVPQAVTNLPALANQPVVAGAFLPDGNYMLWGGGTAYRVSVPDGTVIGQVSTGPLTAFNIGDWAASPEDGRLYAYNAATNRMTVFYPDMETFADTGPEAPTRSDGSVVTDYVTESAFFDQAGNFFLYGQSVELGGTQQRALYYVDVGVTGSFLLIGDGPSVTSSGGASCALGNPTLVTRELGFYRVHERAVEACLAAGPLELGPARVTSPTQALAVLWDSPALDRGGGARRDEDALRVRVRRELLVATCNTRLFGANLDAESALIEATEALTPPSLTHGEAALERLVRFNASGTRAALPRKQALGPATPVRALEASRRVPVP